MKFKTPLNPPGLKPFFFETVRRMRAYPENGLLYLYLIKSTHLVKAYKKTQEIVVSVKKYGYNVSVNNRPQRTRMQKGFF